MHAFLGLDAMRSAFLQDFFVMLLARNNVQKKRRRVSEGDYTAKCPSNADIRDGEGEGMDLISVSHASHGSPC